MGDGVASAEELLSRVERIVVKATRLDPARVTADSTFADLGLDSLDAMTIVFQLEDEFGITISDEEARSIGSIRQIVERLQPILGARAPHHTA
jgi:acyl carrier protein